MSNIKEEKVIVTMTSWPGKMKYDISPTIESLLNGTRKPDKFILNLSEEEWKDVPLPDYVKRLEEKYPEFEIFWVKGPNTKTFKKLIPTLERFPQDILMTVDDDVIYPDSFIAEMLKSFQKDSKRPVTASYFHINGVLFVWGGASLYKAEFLKGYEEMIDDEIISTYEDDWFYTYVLLKNGIKVQLAPSEICYTPFRYPQNIYEEQMYVNRVYTSNKTKEILDKKLESMGLSFDSLADQLFEKYGSTL